MNKKALTRWSKLTLPVALMAVSLSVSAAPQYNISGSAMEKMNESATSRLQVNPNMRLVRRCPGRDPAVTNLVVTNKRVSSTGRGIADFKATVKNLGMQDFVSNPNQASLTIQSHNKRVSGPNAYRTLKTQRIGRLNAGATLNVSARLVTDNFFIQWGHRTARHGECQVERDIIASLNYDPDILLDANPRNDDCNFNNNRRKLTLKYMARCPW